MTKQPFNTARRDPNAKGDRFRVGMTGQILAPEKGGGISLNEMNANLAAAATAGALPVQRLAVTRQPG